MSDGPARAPRASVPVRRILAALARAYPDARCGLVFSNPFELLVATILSAQCTDSTVNRVTPRLFASYPTPADYCHLTPGELEGHIKECGLYRVKARHILAVCRILVDEHGGRVPADREALERLPGVGRKTANVVLSNAFGVPAIAVDTHVFRVANRLGLADGRDPLTVEKQLMERIPRRLWSQAHHWLISHGRQVCHARQPRCGECCLRSICSWVKKASGATGKNPEGPRDIPVPGSSRARPNRPLRA